MRHWLQALHEKYLIALECFPIQNISSFHVLFIVKMHTYGTQIWQLQSAFIEFKNISKLKAIFNQKSILQNSICVIYIFNVEHCLLCSMFVNILVAMLQKAFSGTDVLQK